MPTAACSERPKVRAPHATREWWQARACTVAPTVPQMGSTVIEQSCGEAPQMVYNSAGVAGACCAAGAAGSNVHRKREWRAAASIGEK